MGLVPSCHRVFLGSSWVLNFFSWLFDAFQIFSRGYFVGPVFFFVGISWSRFFSPGYFVVPQFFLVGFSWVPNFFSWVSRGFKIFSRGEFRNFLVFAV